MTSEPFGVGVVGTGMAAKPHALALNDLAGRIAVRGVHSRTAERRAAFCAEHGFAEATSLDALADDPAVGAVIVITPPDQRLELVERFAAAGKHILMEKPLERTSKAARHIVETCEKVGVHLAIVFQHRFRRASQVLARLVSSGDLGAIGLVRAAVPWWREQSYYDEPGRGTYARDGGGVLISQAIHTLDLMVSIAGPVAQVQAVAGTTPFHRMQSEDFVAGGLRFQSGAMGSVMATVAAYPGEAESIALDCENGSAHLQSGTLTLRWRDGRIETFGEAADGTGGGADPMAFPFDWHRDLIADFVSAIQAGRPPAVTGRDALKVHDLIDALIASSREGRAVTIREEG